MSAPSPAPPTASPLRSDAARVGPTGAVLDPALTDPAVAALLAELDASASRQIPPHPNTVDAYANDWRAWVRFLTDFNAALRAADPDAPEIPDTATNYGLFVAFVGWHETRGLAPATIRRRVYGVAVTQRRRGVSVPPESLAAALRKTEIYEENWPAPVRNAAAARPPRSRSPTCAASVPACPTTPSPESATMH